MKKNVYSLVLTDDVVDKIDLAAQRLNTSRSNLINRILAEYVSLTTPEMRMNDIFDYVRNEMLSFGNMQIQELLSDSMLSFKNTVRYKYNPTVRYVVELYRNDEEAVGELKVLFRTQSDSFLSLLNDFFTLWVEAEGADKSRYSVSDGRFTRIFTVEKKITHEQIASYISNYIKALDEAMKIYFENINKKNRNEIKKLFLKGVE